MRCGWGALRVDVGPEPWKTETESTIGMNCVSQERTCKTMNVATVTVEFKPPRKVVEYMESYSFEGRPLILPKSQTGIQRNVEGRAVKVTMPEWLARDRGLTGRVEEDNDSTMTREDWFLLGATMAFLIRGESINEAVWGARKAVAKMVGQECEETI